MNLKRWDLDSGFISKCEEKLSYSCVSKMNRSHLGARQIHLMEYCINNIEFIMNHCIRVGNPEQWRLKRTQSKWCHKQAPRDDQTSVFFSKRPQIRSNAWIRPINKDSRIWSQNHVKKHSPVIRTKWKMHERPLWGNNAIIQTPLRHIINTIKNNRNSIKKHWRTEKSQRSFWAEKNSHRSLYYQAFGLFNWADYREVECFTVCTYPRQARDFTTSKK